MLEPQASTTGSPAAQLDERAAFREPDPALVTRNSEFGCNRIPAPLLRSARLVYLREQAWATRGTARVKYEKLRYPLCASLALTFFAGMAGAQSSTKAAGAEALYEEARGLMKQGDFERACPKFKQSHELDPGGGTLLNLAECYEKQGKFASAWSTFKEALVVAQRDGRPERVEYAKKHLAVVEPKLSKITIEVSSEANEPGLMVTLDGAPLGAAAWGVGMPVDPGTHQVSASAPGKSSFEQRVEIESGSTTLKIPKLASAGATRPVDTDTEKKPVTDEPSAAQPGNGRRTAGFVIGGVGIVALGVGSYFGVRAFSKWSERNDNCGGGCNDAAKSAGDAAKSAATVANIGIGLGIAAVAVGGYLVLSAKSSSEPSASRSHGLRQARALQFLPTLGPTGGGLLLIGAY
ncbi:MAG TPA: tetratricopeptide repeat protein [Polyangiaceae bacterium]